MRHICSSKVLSFKIQMCSLKNSSHLARTTFQCKKNGAKKEDANNKYFEVCIFHFQFLFNSRLCKCYGKLLYIYSSNTYLIHVYVLNLSWYIKSLCLSWHTKKIQYDIYLFAFDRIKILNRR